MVSIGTKEGGQATLELLAAVPLLLLAGSIALQLLLAAGALALAGGQPAKTAAEESLPAWADGDSEVSVNGGEVTVRLRPPSLFPAVADRLSVTSTSFARPAGR